MYRKNLVTGKAVRLAAALSDPADVHVSVYENGGWVGWNEEAPNIARFVPRNMLRNAKTLAPAISLRHTLYSLTSAGALLDSTATADPQYFQNVAIPRPTKFWLRSYSGHTSVLLAKRAFIAGPQIAGNVLAWAGWTGVLHAASLS